MLVAGANGGVKPSKLDPISHLSYSTGDDLPLVRVCVL